MTRATRLPALMLSRPPTSPPIVPRLRNRPQHQLVLPPLTVFLRQPPTCTQCTTGSAVEAHEKHPGDSSDRPGETPCTGTNISTTQSTNVVSEADPHAMEVTEQRPGADPLSSQSSFTADPPASAVPVPPHSTTGTASTKEPPPHPLKSTPRQYSLLKTPHRN